jgi:hypothetical protein
LGTGGREATTVKFIVEDELGAVVVCHLPG